MKKAKWSEYTIKRTDDEFYYFGNDPFEVQYFVEKKKRIRMKKVKNIIGWFCLGLGALVVIFVRWSNPDISETRLFVDFWYYWVAVLAFNIVGVNLTYGLWSE